MSYRDPEKRPLSSSEDRMVDRSVVAIGGAAIAFGLILLLGSQASFWGIVRLLAGIGLIAGGAFWLRAYWRDVL